MVRIIVTGGSGMIGSRFLALLPWDFRLVSNVDRAVGLDLLDWPELVRTVGSKKADVLIHFAAFTDVSDAAGQEGDLLGSCYQINVVGTKHAINLAKHFRCRLVHISTDYVFDGKKTTPYVEDDPPSPIEWYGRTKLEAEELVKSSGTEWIIVRTAFPFVSSYPQKLDLVRSRLVKMQSGSLPPQFTDHVITPTFVDELVQALVLLSRDGVCQQIYHIVGDTHVTDFEISTIIATIFGLKNLNIKPSSIVAFNKTAARPYQKYTALSNGKFERQFGDVMGSFSKALETMKRQGVDGFPIVG